MNDETIRVEGSESNIDELYNAIRRYAGKGIDISTPIPVRGSLTGRTPLGQVALLEIVVSVLGSIAASAAYDGIKKVIAAAAKDGKVAATPPSTLAPAQQKNVPQKGRTKARAKSLKRPRK
jgi:hypothetical protein